MKQLLYITTAAISGPIIASVILAALYYADRDSRVIKDFRITKVVSEPNGEVISGTFNKVRSCTFKTLVGLDDDGNIYGVDYSRDLVNSRPLGLQKFGPWLVRAPSGRPLRLITVHTCHALWDHQETLGVLANIK